MTPERRAELIAKHGVRFSSRADAAVADFDPFLARARAAVESERVEISQYAPPSFWTAPGTIKRTAQLKRKGFPSNLTNWKFVTATIDRALYDSPEDAFNKGARHMRQFLYELRQKYTIRRYLWKLEFHDPDENGDQWPHWHLLIDYKRKIDAKDIQAAWGKGRTEIKNVEDESFDYLTKYVTKSCDDIPEWIGKRNRVRVWQTSSGFYDVGEPEDEKEEEIVLEKTFEQEFDEIIREAQRAEYKEALERHEAETGETHHSIETIKERVVRWLSMAQIKVIKSDDKPIYFAAKLNDQWKQIVLKVARIAVKAVDFVRSLTVFNLEPRKITLPLHTCLQQQQLLQLILKHPCAMGVS